MPTNILMPALSPTMEKGNLAKWLKKEGDKVKSGDVLAEIETDKATMEYEAIDEGTLAKIVVPEGSQDVAVNSVIAVLAGEGEDVKSAASAKAEAPKQPAKKEEPKKAEAAKPQPGKRRAEAGRETIRASAFRCAKSPAGAKRRQPHLLVTAGAPPGERRRASISQRVEGSGPHGRIIARDIDAAKSGKGLRGAGAPASAAAGAIAPALSDKQILGLYEEGSYELVPHDSMRRTIAQRLTASTQNVPHFYLTLDCDIGRLLAAREEINAAAPKDKEGKPAYKLSVNDFVIKALALALQRVPEANVSWTEGGMLKHKHSDVGVAVALPGWPDHPDHSPGRNEVALGDCQ